jgi:AcrR family transcriptional regulator
MAMPEWVPVPGSAKDRLIRAAMHEFERDGFEASSVTAIAAKAGVTTGSLYHHFGSKLDLYLLVRTDVERRIADRMEGAVASVESGRSAVRAALVVGFDAAVRFDACRLLGEPTPSDRPDVIQDTLAAALPADVASGGAVLAAAWRAALQQVADGITPGDARRALEFVVG